MFYKYICAVEVSAIFISVQLYDTRIIHPEEQAFKQCNVQIIKEMYRPNCTLIKLDKIAEFVENSRSRLWHQHLLQSYLQNQQMTFDIQTNTKHQLDNTRLLLLMIVITRTDRHSQACIV